MVGQSTCCCLTVVLSVVVRHGGLINLMLTNCGGSMPTDFLGVCRMLRWVNQFDADWLCTVAVVDAPPLSFHSSCNTIKMDEKHLRSLQEKHSYGKRKRSRVQQFVLFSVRCFISSKWWWRLEKWQIVCLVEFVVL